ncbi:unnamed protein product (mitochondrion) [Plasmodiophora brassicae]|uniref:Band 7 domain-containing protein n=1 Tax=Plasmodiophora brassicae TaxID=37360 RepID=A0A0G4IKU2_PLABS|nr:hypothetical protein PBRA_004420 [Plasmodiophora brassicae]SPQ99957.1 unnamed protein product [Plasmodiophora brassicae]
MKYGLLFVWALVLCSCMGLSYKTFQEWSSSCNICQHESMADGKCTVDNYGQSTVTLVQCCYSVVAGRDMGIVVMDPERFMREMSSPDRFKGCDGVRMLRFHIHASTGKGHQIPPVGFFRAEDRDHLKMVEAVEVANTRDDVVENVQSWMGHLSYVETFRVNDLFFQNPGKQRQNRAAIDNANRKTDQVKSLNTEQEPSKEFIAHEPELANLVKSKLAARKKYDAAVWERDGAKASLNDAIIVDLQAEADAANALLRSEAIDKVVQERYPDLFEKYLGIGSVKNRTEADQRAEEDAIRRQKTHYETLMSDDPYQRLNEMYITPVTERDDLQCRLNDLETIITGKVEQATNGTVAQCEADIARKTSDLERKTKELNTANRNRAWDGALGTLGAVGAGGFAFHAAPKEVITIPTSSTGLQQKWVGMGLLAGAATGQTGMSLMRHIKAKGTKQDVSPPQARPYEPPMSKTLLLIIAAAVGLVILAVAIAAVVMNCRARPRKKVDVTIPANPVKTNFE